MSDEEKKEPEDDLMAELSKTLDGAQVDLQYEMLHGRLVRLGVTLAAWRTFMIAQGFTAEWAEEATMVLLRGMYGQPQ